MVLGEVERVQQKIHLPRALHGDERKITVHAGLVLAARDDVLVILRREFGRWTAEETDPPARICLVSMDTRCQTSVLVEEKRFGVLCMHAAPIHWPVVMSLAVCVSNDSCEELQ